MFDNYDVITLTVDLPDHRLVCGSIGTALLVYEDGACEAEFVSPEGLTLAVTNLEPTQFRIASPREIASWRGEDEPARPADL